MTENELSRVIIGGAIEVRRELGGPGLLEDVYEEALCYELMLRNLRVTRQVAVPVIYKKTRLKKPMLMDLLVNDKVVVEVKAVEKYNSLFSAQLLTYLKLAHKKLGLVINFGDELISKGVHRVVNGL